MEIIPWIDDYTTTIGKIDEQHKKLVNYINRLYTAMHNKRTHVEIEEILEGLTVYTIQHFRHEEQLMFTYSYADYYRHKDQHTSFLHKVIDFKVKYKEGDENLGTELAVFLKKWLINHIAGSDKIMCKYLNDNGFQ
jgi:hemerythrin